MASKPIASAKPQVFAKLSLLSRKGKILPGTLIDNVGYYFSKCEFKAMVNGGYTLRLDLYDAAFALHSAMVEKGYFAKARANAILIEFQLKWSSKNESFEVDNSGQVTISPKESTDQYTSTKTKMQRAIVVSMKVFGENDDQAHIEMIAIDPAAFYLNMGDGSGKGYEGAVHQVIENVIKDYFPLVGELTVSKTTDFPSVWWMMRQDPKTFLSSLFDWSASITEKRTHWIIASDGFNLAIKEQAHWSSKQRAEYTFAPKKGGRSSDIREFDILTENALASVESKLIVQGISAISGQYLDRTTDPDEKHLYVKDSTTTNKIIPRIKEDQGFAKAADGDPPQVGWSSISSIPEFNSGELGIPYNEYIDGRARGLYLNLAQATFRARITITGHGEYNSNFGLGIDTVFIKWTQVKNVTAGSSPEALAADLKKDANSEYWWMSGSWIVYGFHHKVTRGDWTTELYLTRYDYNAEGKRVP